MLASTSRWGRRSFSAASIRRHAPNPPGVIASIPRHAHEPAYRKDFVDRIHPGPSLSTFAPSTQVRDVGQGSEVSDALSQTAGPPLRIPKTHHLEGAS